MSLVHTDLSVVECAQCFVVLFSTGGGGSGEEANYAPHKYLATSCNASEMRAGEPFPQSTSQSFFLTFLASIIFSSSHCSSFMHGLHDGTEDSFLFIQGKNYTSTFIECLYKQNNLLSKASYTYTTKRGIIQNQ